MNQKVKMLSKSISILLNVFIVLLVAQVIYFLYVFGGGSITYNTELPSGLLTVFSFASSSGEVDQSVVETINLTTRFLLLFLTLVGSFVVARIFSGIAKSEGPFKIIQARKIYFLSGVTFVAFLIQSFLPPILYTLFLEGRYVQMNFDGGLLLIALMFYTVAEIFKHGESLQKDVDETL